MLFLLLSVVCSVTVGVIFKMSRRYDANPKQIVAFNYATAVLLCYLFFEPNFTDETVVFPWKLYVPLGILLPTIFLVLAKSIQQVGIVKTDAAQRLSLFIPILAAWLLFGESFSVFKVSALVIAFPALLCILNKPNQDQNSQWIYPAIVLVGFGAIDILFKQVALHTTLPYTTSLFVVFAISLTIMVGVLLYQIGIQKQKFVFKNVLFGIAVGLFNFGNILFYLKAHQEFALNPSTVFAGMNMGVIVLGSVVGVLAFKEKLSKLNYVGLIAAIAAIILIVLS
ncbi:EamA family transporter [Flavobacterium turcicum]|uniref:EamA family transporter n=1 Tax=Flavobacterium turcicum TaxID=2764718 RepID=A0ABR7JF28_9FLAO|nr:EamA family transporter [Flavobacterium turcicum]MBC5862764.1 EamA family transporter [Flavobacterium turcicum]NHL01496.1 EamA family transporter [Flavobacterium turcicum]